MRNVNMTVAVMIAAVALFAAGCDQLEEMLDGAVKADGGGGGGNDAGGGGDAGQKEDAGAGEDSGVKEDAGVTEDTGGPIDGGGSTLPYIDSIDPTNGPVNTEVALTINGQNFAQGAAVYFGTGSALSGATVVDATKITVTVPASSTPNPGQYQIYVENTPGAFMSRSNVAYFTVNAAAGAPVVVDYSPDNGLEGDKILIIGDNLSGETLTIKDAAGKQVTSSTFGTISVWGGDKETAEFTIPQGWSTGAITVSNSKGSFTGKIFNMGQNLTVLAGSVPTASSEYSSTWPVAKGADNKLETSWFSKNGDCATSRSCTTVPWFLVTFAADHDVGRIAMRGNREYLDGYDFIKGKFEILDGSDHVVWGQSYSFPAPDRDLDIKVSPAVGGRKVKFTSLADESDEPGFAELEVFE